jgi:hypothetical protein
VCLGVLGCAFIGYVGYLSYRTWNPWTTDDISRYPEMRNRLVEIYPRSPDILPQTIPTDSSNIQFIASPNGALRQGPFIVLIVTLPEEAASIEMNRLLQIASSNDDFSFTLNGDGTMYFEYRKGSGSTYTRNAIVSYEPHSQTFNYELSAGY